MCGKNVDSGYVRQIINLTQTTSGSYLLLSSLDISRKNLYLNGKDIFKRTVSYTKYAREEINAIGGYYAFGDELTDGDTVYRFDPTKLSVNTRNIGLAGIEVYDLLRDEYDIQIEFGDLGNILAIVSGGERELEIERLISALSEIKRIHGTTKAKKLNQEYIEPVVKSTPHEAFFAEKKCVPLSESAGCISTECVMCYPPGIPIIAPGELMTERIINYIRYAKKMGCQVTGTEDMNVQYINVIK